MTPIVTQPLVRAGEWARAHVTPACVDYLVADGYTSFKVYMTYDDVKLSDREMLEILPVGSKARASIPPPVAGQRVPAPGAPQAAGTTPSQSSGGGSAAKCSHRPT